MMFWKLHMTKACHDVPFPNITVALPAAFVCRSEFYPSLFKPIDGLWRLAQL